jgi:hypothetical protein
MTLALTASAGLIIDTQEEIRAALIARLESVLGPLNTDPRSNIGQIVNVFSEFRAVDQQALLAVYRSFDPGAAAGPALDARAALTGSTRRGESFSSVAGLVTFTGVGVLLAGSLIKHTALATSWELLTTVVAPGAGLYPATFRAVDPGPLEAKAGTAWTTVTIVANYTGFSNPIDDATLGELTEGDPAFRVRRALEIYSQNTGPLAAIEGVVSKVSTAAGRVTAVRAYHNPKIQPADSDGIPFKAFNVVLETDPPLPNPQIAGPVHPLAQAIADAIWTATGAGGEAYGTSYGLVQAITVIDAEGQAQDGGGFDVVKRVNVYIDVNITTEGDPEDGPVIPEQPASMAQVVRSAVALEAAASFTQLGRNARALDHAGTVDALIRAGQLGGIASAVVGVSLTAPLAADPPITTLTANITIRQRADYNTGAIRVFLNGSAY